MKTYIYLIMIALVALALFGCSDEDDSQTDYNAILIDGWEEFVLGNYADAEAKFQQLVDANEMLGKAYNGLGWCALYQDQLDNAETDFSKALQEELDDDTYQDVIGGLVIVYDALNRPQDCVDSSGNLSTDWVFSHDETLDYDDIILIRAISYYALGEFENSLTEVQKLDPDFSADVSTVEGRADLANKIEQLGG